MKRPNVVRQGTLEVPMTPMIDVVFLLLIFFVWTTSFAIPESDLLTPVSAPLASAGGQGNSNRNSLTPSVDEIVVRIRTAPDGIELTLNEQPVENPSLLVTRLTEILKLGLQPPVIVAPDGRVPMSEAVKVFDVARSAGADRVLFAVEGPL
jgi:biopolymer transport protein ExbD